MANNWRSSCEEVITNIFSTTVSNVQLLRKSRTSLHKNSLRQCCFWWNSWLDRTSSILTVASRLCQGWLWKSTPADLIRCHITLPRSQHPSFHTRHLVDPIVTILRSTSVLILHHTVFLFVDMTRSTIFWLLTKIQNQKFGFANNLFLMWFFLSRLQSIQLFEFFSPNLRVLSCLQIHFKKGKNLAKA